MYYDDNGNQVTRAGKPKGLGRKPKAVAQSKPAGKKLLEPKSVVKIKMEAWMCGLIVSALGECGSSLLAGSINQTIEAMLTPMREQYTIPDESLLGKLNEVALKEMM